MNARFAFVREIGRLHLLAAFCADVEGVLGLDALPLPPPQAARLAVRPVTSAPETARRNILRCIAKIPLSVDSLPAAPAVNAIAPEADVG